MSQKRHAIYLRRIEHFLNRIEKRIVRESLVLEAKYACTAQPVPFKDRLHCKFQSGAEGMVWGKTWESAWFHLLGHVPESWAGEEVVAQLDFGGEGLVFTADGQPLQSLSGGSVFEDDYHRDVVRLFSPCQGGEEVELWVETAANSLFGITQDADPPTDNPDRFGHYEGKIHKMRLAKFDLALWHLWLDVDVLLGVLKSQPEQSVRRERILRHLNLMIDQFADDAACADRCSSYVREHLFTPATPSDLRVAAVGHAHIDTAWLWPVQETIRKCARTFANQLSLLRRYPEFVFGASQPQLYVFVKNHYPKLFREIKKWVKAGRWEVQGGMWIEADCNLISGESMIRQILHGKNFFKDEFGIDVKHLWLPDVFGYSAALPQILRKSGIDFFLTQKISWNQFNKFPHHTFKWRGIDGSEVLTHFPPEETYNSHLYSHSLAKARDRFAEKSVLDEFICLFGVGDGGGGPTENQIERGIRLANLEGCPQVSFDTATAFFERLRRHESELATWAGELYLELHRGTLTTQALAKKRNRQLENRLRQLEMLWCCLPLQNYPADELERIWKIVLLNQFHDILPGSSINKVYKVTHKEYEQAQQSCEALEKQATDLLFARDSETMVLFNSLTTAAREAIELPENWQAYEVSNSTSGESLPVQNETGMSTVLVTIPALDFLVIQKGKKHKITSSPQVPDEMILENDRIRYVFADDGTLAHVFDKEADREVLPQNQKGNVLSLYEDRPNDWDAWDIDLFYENNLLENAELIEWKGLARGPVRTGISLTFRVGHSRIEQNVYLAAHTKRLDFRTKVDWCERHRMLRVAFAVDVVAETARFDIQYGFVERPTHRNTTWDLAKFEVAGHRYADLSQGDYGAALLNDCKYGYKVFNRIIDLNLLRSPSYPDPDADLGMHEFTYSFLPHLGDLVHSDVMREAALLNDGLALFPSYHLQNHTALPCTVEGEGIRLGALKKAEKSDALIVRLVEERGRCAKGQLVLHIASAEIFESDLVEWSKKSELPLEKSLELDFKPFEIKTLFIKLKQV